MDRGQVVRHVAFALAMGAVGAAASVALSLAVDGAASLQRRFPWLLFALPAFGLASLGLYRLFRLKADLATEDVVDGIRANRRTPALLAPGILAGTCLTVLGGGSVGKEAAALQMGASLGSTVGRLFRLRPIRGSDDDPLAGYAAACGMAAAFSALFFTPLGSTMFVLELVRFRKSVVRHVPTMLLAALAAFALASAVGIGDVIPKAAVPAPSWGLAAQCLIVGLAAGAAGAVFAAAVRALKRALSRRFPRQAGPVLTGGLLFAGLVLLFGWQGYEGTGMDLLAAAMHGQAAPEGFAVKALLTVVALGFGFKGGEIMPMFTIGALLGAAVALFTGADVGFSAALGLAAFFGAASRCPLAAFLMSAEIFGVAAAPYLAVAVAVAYAGSRDVGMYGHGIASVALRLRRGARQGA